MRTFLLTGVAALGLGAAGFTVFNYYQPAPSPKLTQLHTDLQNLSQQLQIENDVINTLVATDAKTLLQIHQDLLLQAQARQEARERANHTKSDTTQFLRSVP